MSCIFCRIASGEIPADIIARSDSAIAFRDLNPKAPTHVLVIPVKHLANSAEATGEEGAKVLASVMRLGVDVAAQLGLAEAGYRFVMNTGPDGGQSVDHLHLHLLGVGRWRGRRGDGAAVSRLQPQSQSEPRRHPSSAARGISREWPRNDPTV